MARVKLLSLKEIHPDLRPVYEKMESHGFPVLNIYRALAHSPELALGFMRFGNRILFKAKLDAKLREIAILRVAHLTKAAYERVQHEEIARRLGMPKQQIMGVKRWKTGKHFSVQERAVLQYTDELTKSIRAKNATFKNLRKFLSEQEIVELTLTIGMYNLVSRFLEALQIDLEDKRFNKA
jgi:4-carboxymuconolactone decarboxylase